MEEIGKALIDGWSAEAPLGEPRSRSLHIQKQLAVSSLLSGELAVQQFREGGVADLEGEKKTTVTRIFNESDEGQLFQRIRAQQLDFRKQNALYQHDRLAAVTDDFAEEHVASVLQIANNARGVINDGHIRRAGRRVLSDDAGRRIICLKLRELVRAKTREQLIF